MQQWIKAHPTITTVAVVLLGIDVIGAALTIVLGVAGIAVAAASGAAVPPASGSSTPPGTPPSPSTTMAAGMLPVSDFVRQAVPKFNALALVPRGGSL